MFHRLRQKIDFETLNMNTAINENESPDMCSLAVSVINETDVSFAPDYTLLSGKWVKVPLSLPANQMDSSLQAFRSISRHHGAGIKGVVSYSSDHSDAIIFIRWDIPLSGNRLDVNVTCEGLDLGSYAIRLENHVSHPNNYKSILYVTNSSA